MYEYNAVHFNKGPLGGAVSVMYSSADVMDVASCSAPQSTWVGSSQPAVSCSIRCLSCSNTARKRNSPFLTRKRRKKSATNFTASTKKLTIHLLTLEVIRLDFFRFPFNFGCLNWRCYLFTIRKVTVVEGIRAWMILEDSNYNRKNTIIIDWLITDKELAERWMSCTFRLSASCNHSSTLTPPFRRHSILASAFALDVSALRMFCLASSIFVSKSGPFGSFGSV